MAKYQGGKLGIVIIGFGLIGPAMFVAPWPMTSAAGGGGGGGSGPSGLKR